MSYYLTFKWSARGYKGYAGNYCRLYVNGILKGSASGGGYDMKGTCVGEWLEKDFKLEVESIARAEIKEAQANPSGYYNDKGGGVYGLIVSREKNDDRVEIRCNGACGQGQMFKILERLGWEVEQTRKLLKSGIWKWLNEYNVYKPKMREFEGELKGFVDSDNPEVKRHARGLAKALNV